MATVTSPIILDSTGQDIKTSIDLLTANINRTASNIPYDNNLTIKGKIDAINLTEGGTIGGGLNINVPSGSTARGTSQITLGNNIPTGTVGNSRGTVALYSDNQYVSVLTPYTLTADRVVYLPDGAGTIALTSDVTFKTLNRNTWAWNSVTSHSIEAISSNTVIVFGARNGRGFLLLCPNNNAESLSIFNNTGCGVSHTFDSSTNKHTITLSNPTSTTGSSVVVTAIG